MDSDRILMCGESVWELLVPESECGGHDANAPLGDPVHAAPGDLLQESVAAKLRDESRDAALFDLGGG